MKYIITLILALSMSIESQSQDLPYREVPKYPDTFTAGTVSARMIDGLGFRFYWSSEGLTEKDLDYKPNDDSRTTAETIDHILDLSYVIVNSTLKKENSKVDSSGLSYEEKRAQVLKNLKTTADILRSSDDISQYKIVFGEREFPFWNQINGPIADALWHCGQLAINRRSSGNPINPNISHFTGTVKE
ncbi:hypothetical protein AB9K26_06800 [Psychroserpens sp. XS_ASV72]|uniref:hypothetical protein n=1 Tax=Psychroserpens sp. XS_ASV72 TaxID=3241293 RepID=UPI003517E67E